MITIDGSYGEGGGQILRTSLALSMVTGKPFTITHIRAGRRKPGLMRQHLTALNAAAAIGQARVTGNSIGSTTVAFSPQTVRPGQYQFAVGSAGSCTLVLHTILPALLVAAEPSEIVLSGGTHNPFAPPFDFLEKAFLPLINRMGPRVTATLQKTGFYPAGGGQFTVQIEPVALTPLEILERGALLRKVACAAVARLSLNIARRELKVVRQKLGGDDDLRLKAVKVDNSPGPGNIITVELVSANITELFSGFGERGVRADKVAKRVVGRVRQYLDADMPVGPYLADQLLIPLALAGGGRFRTLTPTKHTTTNIAIIQRFLDVAIDIREFEPNCWEVRIGTKKEQRNGVG